MSCRYNWIKLKILIKYICQKNTTEEQEKEIKEADEEKIKEADEEKIKEVEEKDKEEVVEVVRVVEL